MKKDLLAILLIVLVTWIIFYRLFLPEPKLAVTPDFSRSDSWHLGIPMKYVFWQKLQKNELPFWSSKIYSGFPILGDGQTGLFFLPNLILFKLFPFVTAFNLSFVFAYIWLGVGMYYWLGTFHFSHRLRLYGALTLMCSGITFARWTHLAVLQALSFMPWVFITTWYLHLKKNFWAVFVFSLMGSQQLLSGFTQASVITQMLAAAYLAFLQGRWRDKVKDCGLFLGGLVLIVGFSAVHILPAQEFIRNSVVPMGFNLRDAIRYSYPLRHLLTYINPFYLGNPKQGTYPQLEIFDESIFWENTGYIGLVPFLGLAILIFWRKKLTPERRRLVLFCIFGSLISFLLIWGKYSPIYLLFSLWPFNQFRVTSRYIWIFTILLILLSVIGFEFLEKKIQRRRILLLLSAPLLLVHLFLLIYPWWDYHLLVQAKEWLAEPESVRYLNISSDPRLSTILVETEYREAYENGWTDPQPHAFLRNSLLANSNLFWNIAHTGLVAGRYLRRPATYDNLLTNSLQFNEGKVTLTRFGEKLLVISATTHTVSPYEIQNVFLQKVGILKGTKEIYLYENTRSIPRAYLAQKVTQVDTVERAIGEMASESFLPGKNVVVEESIDISPSDAPDETVQIIYDYDSSLAIKTGLLKQKGLLVLTDTYYPGWKVYVDGQETKIYPANIRQRAVVVPSGIHEVVFKYEPKSFYQGLVISLSSLIVSIVILIRKPIKGLVLRRHVIN